MAAIQNPYSRGLIISYEVQNLHKYIENVCIELNYSSTDVSKKQDFVMLTLIRYNYDMDGYNLFRNDITSKSNDRPY